MTWYLIVLPVTDVSLQDTYRGPNSEPGQLTQPAPVTVPADPRRWVRNSTPTTIQPTSWVDAGNNTVWYFANRFAPWVDNALRSQWPGVGIDPPRQLVSSTSWRWWVQWRGPRLTFTLTGDQDTFLHAQVAGRARIRFFDSSVTDADIITLADLAA